MSGFQILMMGVLVIAPLVYVFRQRQRIMQSAPESTVGSIAQRLGLRIVRGDPEFNLQYNWNGPVAAQHVDILLEGDAYGRAVRVTYFRKVEDVTKLGEALVGQARTRLQWDCRIEVPHTAKSGRFEVRLRHPPPNFGAQSVFASQDPLRARDLPDADLQARLLFESDERDVVAQLTPHLHGVANVPYVHVVGESGRVWFDMAHVEKAVTQQGIATAYGFHAVEEIVYGLVCMACALEGQPTPAQLSPVHAPSTAT